MRGYLNEDFKGRQILTKIRADDLELGAASFRGLGHYMADSCKTCNNIRLIETREHFLLTCGALEGARERHPEVKRWIQDPDAERAMALITLAFPTKATEDMHRARMVGAYLHDLWTT